MLRTLRQPRYAALSVLMLLVALICIAAGTWQIARFDAKVGANDQLRINARAPTVPVADVLPVTGAGHPPSAHTIQYRTVVATGTYDAANQSLVRQRTIDANNDDDTGGDTGYLVLTPLQTPSGDLLVVRGFISATASNGALPTAPTPTTASVTVRARVQPPETRNDAASALPAGQVESINPGEQAARLGRPVYAGYATLLAKQPGTESLVAIPPPDLSNPAGGAVEPQHFAYILQWYLFALLALAAPFAMVRAERRQRSGADLGDVTGGPAELLPETDRAAKLADRYGRVAR